jgi:hypothetical protein
MTMKVRVLLVLMVGLATMWTASCGHYVCGSPTLGSSTCTASGGGISQGGGSSGAAAFTYFEGSPGMGLISVDLTSAKLTDVTNLPQPPLPYTTVAAGGMVVINKKYLYIAFTNGTLYGFSIDGTSGTLTAVSTNPYTVFGGDSIAGDPSGRFLFVGDIFGQQVTAFTVSSTDGTLTQVGSPFGTSGVGAAQLATDGKGRYLYAAEGYGGTKIAALAYNQTTGALSTITGSPFSATNFDMAQLAGEATGNYLLGIRGTLPGGGVDNNVYVFGITQATGALSSATVFPTVYTPSNMTVSPNGSFLYTFNEDSGTNSEPMEGYTLSGLPTTLSAVTGSPFSLVDAQNGQFEQTGQYLIAVISFVAEASGTETVPLTANTSTGTLTSTAASSPAPQNSIFVVTDAP